MDEHSLITYPTWKKYLILSCFVEQLKVREKRHIFHIMRKHIDTLTHDSFFPQYGITAGEFATWQVLSENRKNRVKKNVKTRDPLTPTEKDAEDVPL